MDPISIRDSSIVGSLLADSEFDISNAFKFTCSSIFPHTSFLGFNFQAGVRKWWSSISHWSIIVGEGLK